MLRVLMLCALWGAAPGCDSSKPAPVAAVGVAAGNVLDISGTVNVRRGSAVTPLVEGATVEADDTIETGADGHAVIELVHNLAKWDLGPNKKTKVRESMAWKLAKNEGTAAVVEQVSESAGKPAERSAVDTTASAAPGEDAGDTSAKNRKDDSNKVAATDGGGKDRPHQATPKTGGSLRLGGGGEGGGGKGIGIGTLGTIGKGSGTGTGTGYGAGKSSHGGKLSRGGGKPKVTLGASAVQGGLDKTLVTRVVRQNMNQIRYCYERELARDPNLAGKLTVKFTIDAKGAVIAASAAGLNPTVEACVSAVFKRMRFPAPQGGGEATVTYPFAFQTR